MDFLKQLSLAGLVPVIALEDPEDAVPLCAALARGGLPVAEITFRTAAAEESIRRVHDALPDVLLCAGTVLTPDQADRAVRAGAAAVVSPGLNPRVVEHCVGRGIPVCPGISTASEVETALSFGLKTVKVFPAEAVGGIALIRGLAAPYADVTFMPTGGVNESNMMDYLAFPKVLCCGGSWMVPKDAVRAKDWARITALTRSAVNRMLGLELRGVRAKDAREAEDVIRLARLMGWEVSDDGAAAVPDAGAGAEWPGGEAAGQIRIASNFPARARWHLERRGFAFDGESGGKDAARMREPLAGYEVWLTGK